MSAGLTQERLKEIVAYDAVSGLFIRLKSVSNVQAGPVRPRPGKNGYLRMRIDGRLYYMQRLAWLYVHGVWPNNLVDHEDGDKENNSIDNLRDTNHGGNLENISATTKNGSGFRGVYQNKQTGRWQAKITAGYKQINGGHHDTPELAHEAYLRLKAEHHKFQPEFNR